GAVRHHVVDAVAAPRRNPPDVAVDGVERRLPQRAAAEALRPGAGRRLVQRDETLRGGEEDHRVVAAPAVWILVRERLAVPQPPAFLQRLLDSRIGVEHSLAAEHFRALEERLARPALPCDLERYRTSVHDVVG